MRINQRTAIRIGGVSVAALLVASTTAIAPAQADDVTVGDRNFEVTSAEISGSGGYQVAYSEDDDVLWVSATSHHWDLGQPVAAESTISKVDPETMAVLDTITPPTLDEGTEWERPEAAYGLEVDDSTNTVWTSVTREDAVAVYDADTLEQVAYIEDVGHTRDIAIDPYAGVAYVTDPNGGLITKIDTGSYEVLEQLTGLTENFSPMSLDIVATEDSSLLYTVNLNDGVVVELDNRAQDFRVVGSSGGSTASGIAVDESRGLAYVSSQASQDVRTMDLATGEVVNVATASEDQLNTAVDPEEGLVYSTGFGGNHVFVVDADTGESIGQIAVGTSPNDVIVADGSAFAVDRAASAATGNSSLWRLTPGEGGGEPEEPEEPEVPTQASVTVEGDPTLGGTVTLVGEGWVHPNGGGSTVAVKIDRGALRLPDGTDVWAVIEAADDGTFSYDLTLPDGTTATSSPALTTGEHTLFFLSGSLSAGDQARSIQAPVNVAEAPSEPEEVTLTPFGDTGQHYGQTGSVGVEVTGVESGTVTLNGLYRDQSVEIEDGSAVFTVPAYLTVGSFTATYTLNTEGEGDGTTATAAYTVDQGATEIGAEVQTAPTRRNPGVLLVNVAGVSNTEAEAPVPWGAFSVEIRNSSGAVVWTGAKPTNWGWQSFALPALQRGTYEVIATFGATERYAASSVTQTITVR